jgi:type IV fimbrial biogenesis protein FimT
LTAVTGARAFARPAGFARLLVGVASLGGVLALGVPAATDFSARTSVITGADAFLEALHTARMQALKQNAQVTICKSPNALDPSPTCAQSSAEWTEGWVVFVDRGTIGNIEASDKVISKGRPSGKIESVTERPARLASITFNPVGPITGPAGNLEVHLASSLTRGSFERVICLSVLGRAYVAKGSSCHA